MGGAARLWAQEECSLAHSQYTAAPAHFFYSFSSLQVDHSVSDVLEMSSYFATVLLWKWEPLLLGGAPACAVDWAEAPRLVAEALDRALLPGLTAPSPPESCFCVCIMPRYRTRAQRLSFEVLGHSSLCTVDQSVAATAGLPGPHALFVCASAKADEWLVERLGELARLPLEDLCNLLGVGPEHRLDLCPLAASSGAALGTRPLPSGGPGPEGTHYAAAVRALRGLGQSLAPTAKAAALAATCREVCSAVVRWHGDPRKGQLAADDMLPLLQLLIVLGAVTEPRWGGSGALPGGRTHHRICA